MDGTVESSIRQAQDRVIAEMAELDGHLGRYEYLVRLGRKLESPEGIRADQHVVPGCQSRVWIRAETENGRLRLYADSDATITRGIIALLLRVLDGHPPRDVAQAELYFLEETGLGAHLSPSRANGLVAMVKQIRAYAAARS
jgi:cysteine desulfuration protein SufE